MMRPETPSEWKPGDVAMRRGLDGHEQRSVVVSSHGCRDKHTPEPHWHHADGGWDPVEASHQLARYRPLVVIDPEDAGQVERLDDLLARFIEGPEVPDYEGTEGATRAALREFARPTPRIEEPQGLGAVVEAIYDNHFVHLGNGHWSRVGPHDCAPCAFEEIEVVRVLSEGVTP